MNSIIQSGQLGITQSYQRINEAAQNIASGSVSSNDKSNATTPFATDSAVASAAPVAPNTPADKPQVVQPSASLEESVLELRRQQQVFNASANVVSVGQELVGTLLDDYS